MLQKFNLILIILFFNQFLFGQWIETGTKISLIPSDVYLKNLPFTQNGNICSDEKGGAVILWMNSNQIRIQRIDEFGHTLWQEGGIVMSENPNSVRYAQIINTIDSNFAVVWTCNDYLGDLYAQKFNLNGEMLWGDSGISVCDVPLTQYHPQVASTNDGGVIITWMDFRSGHSSDIYAQRLSSDGSLLWESSGIPICVFSSYQNYPKIAHVGDNKFIIIWQDARNFYFHIMANLIDLSGAKLWGQNDKIIFAQTGNSHYPKLIVDDGYSYIVWEHNTRGQYDVRTQKVDINGNLLWGNGVFPVDSTINTNHPFLASDKKGGLFVSWVNNGNTASISLQHIKFDGTLAYGDSGIQVSVPGNPNLNVWPNIISDEKSGCIITWNEVVNPINKVKMQKIDSLGFLIWDAKGIELGSVSGDEQFQQFILTDSGNTILIWIDKRDNSIKHLYASMVGSDGDIVTNVNEINIENPRRFYLEQNYPNPFNPMTSINYQIKEKGLVSLKVFNILGKEVVKLVNEIKDKGHYSIMLDASNLPSGVYIYSLRVNDYVQNNKMILLK